MDEGNWARTSKDDEMALSKNSSERNHSQGITHMCLQFHLPLKVRRTINFLMAPVSKQMTTCQSS